MKFRCQKGGTLIELILYVALISTILTSVSTFLIFVLEGRVKNTLIQETYGQASFAVEVINKSIKEAEEIINPLQSGTSNSLVLVVSGETITFDLSNGKIEMTRGIGLPTSLTNEDLIITNLNFNNYSKDDTSGIIQTTFDVESTSDNNRKEFNFTTSIQTSSGLRPN